MRAARWAGLSAHDDVIGFAPPWQPQPGGDALDAAGQGCVAPPLLGQIPVRP